MLRGVTHKIPVQDVLSRGQQKLLVTALQLAQGKLLQEKTDTSCIYLLDDLPAELDANKRQLMMATLQDLGAQVFVTSLETELLDMLIASHGTSVFHVEHGRVK